MFSKIILTLLSKESQQPEHITCENKARNQQNNYVINKNEFIAKGITAKVYKAYRINPDTNQIDTAHPYAVKIFNNVKVFNVSEVRFFRRYYWAENPVYANKQVFFVMEYLKGENLIEEKENGEKKLHDAVKKLTFAGRINLIANIMMAINIIHHHTPSTGSALFHSDLKGSNIRISVGPNGKIDVHIVDFGLSEEIEDNNILKNTKLRGTAEYIPYEAFSGLRGTKSDIYSLVAVFAFILGAKNPFEKKSKLDINDMDYSTTQFDLTDLFDGIVIPNYPFNILNLIKIFLNKMQDIHHKNRPDTDRTLRFFVSLNLFCYSFENNIEENYAIDFAKLILVTYGFPEQEMDHNTAEEIIQFSEENKLNVELLGKLLKIPEPNPLDTNPQKTKKHPLFFQNDFNNNNNGSREKSLTIKNGYLN